MSYSKDHSRKNPLAPSRMYGMSSSANTNTTPIDNQPVVTTERVTQGGVEGTLTTTKTKPRQSKLPKVGMEEAYNRALKLGYRDKDETIEEFTTRANEFNEGSTKKSFVEDKNKKEKSTIDPIKIKPIKKINTPEAIRPIQGVPVVEEDEVKNKRSFDFTLPDVNLPKINLPKINFPTFQKKSKKPKPVYGIGKNGMQKTRKKNKNTQGRRK